MKLFAVPFAIALAAVPSAAFARPVTAAQQASPAEQLVVLLLPDDKLVDTVSRIIDALVSDDSNISPERRALFAAYPGLKQDVVALIRTDIAAMMLKDLPSLHVELTGVISAELTPAELQQTLTFFTSPTGRKMLSQIYAGLAASNTVDEQEARNKAMATMMASLTPEDYPALAAFGQSSAGPKLKTLSPRIQQASQAWSARFLQENGPALAKRVDDLIAARKAKGK
jgi:hypothetical protein